MGKNRKGGLRPSSAPAPTIVLPTPQAFGPPTPLAPPPNGLVLRMAPGRDALLADLPNGRLATIPCTAEGMDLLVGILHRIIGDLRSPEARPSTARWPKGLAVRFAPPHGSPWREAAFFRPEWDFCPMTVVAEMSGGQILATAPDGKSYTVSPKHLQVDGRITKVPGRGMAGPKSPTRVPTLEELGL